MNFRHEVKHEISLSDMITIRHRLTAVTYSDPYAIDGKYFIRSLSNSERIMTRLNNSHVIDCINETLHIIGEIFVDDISELPTLTGIDGYELI